MKSFRHGLLALAWCLVPNIADGQFVEPPPPPAYAVQGATIVRADGSRAEGVNLVVRGGFIEAIGPDVPIPADALLLEGDSLFVYPGIVDGQSGAVVEFPDVESNPSEVDFWAPARGEQQFTPHRRAADYLTATGSDMAAERSKGVVAGAILAEGPVMPGRGAVLLFRKSADLPSDLVLRPEFGLTTSFRGASGVYPSTGFGMHAFIRQSFEDARHYAVLRTAHAQDPRGIPIPSYDPDYDVLNAALNRQVPVFIQADRSDEIRRALDIAN